MFTTTQNGIANKPLLSDSLCAILPVLYIEIEHFTTKINFFFKAHIFRPSKNVNNAIL